MEGTLGFVGFESPDAFISPLHRRQNGCVKCDDVTPACPDCGDGQICQTRVPMTCHECPSTYCLPDPTASSPESANDGTDPSAVGGGGDSTNIGAIVGGVVGGLIAMAIVTYLVWKYCIKNRRGDEYDGDSQWQHQSAYEPKQGAAHDDAATRQSKRTSTHTVHSIASTVLTRASNIIQIAYIPGVTNRASPSSPTVLVPPVPPIPREHSEAGSGGTGNNSPYEDHFFMPGDLRNSTYSGISNYTDRTSYATRTSYAPRSSVASTIYGNGAVVSPMPAQRGNFLKPSLVSVRTKPGSSNGEEVPPVPPVPQVNIEKYDQDHQQPPPSPSFSIGSNFMKNTSTATVTPMRPQMVSVGSSSLRTVNIKSKTPSVASGSTKVASPTEPTSAAKGRFSSAGTIIDDTPSPGIDQGPFADPSPSAQSDATGLNAISEEPRRPSVSSSSRGRSPFGDENRMRE